MLNAYFGDLPEELAQNYIYNTAVYFNNTYKDRWIVSDFAKEIIAEIDKSVVIDERTIKSPIFGNMSPKKLSGGTKTLLLIKNDHTKIFNASTCGDNCMPALLKIAENKKITVNFRHLPDFGHGEFKLRVLNTGKIVKNMGELVLEAGIYV